MKLVSRVYATLRQTNEWLTVNELSQETGTSTRAIDYALRELQAKRWVKVQPYRAGENGRPSNLWHVA